MYLSVMNWQVSDELNFFTPKPLTSEITTLTGALTSAPIIDIDTVE